MTATSHIDAQKQKSKPRIFAATFVSELSVGAHVGGVGALIVLLAHDFHVEVNDFAILSSFLGIGMVGFSLISKWLLEATAGTILRLASFLITVGAIGLAFAPWIPLVIACGLLVGSGTALIILIVPAVLAGPRRARDIALANGASSAASILAPLLYGVFDSIPGFEGRWAALMLALPPIFVLATIRNVDFVNTPSAYAERRLGRKGKKRNKDLSDAFGPVSSVQAFGGAENVADDELARASLPAGASTVHVADISDGRAEVSQHENSSQRKRRRFQIAVLLIRVSLSVVAEFALYTWGVASLVDIGVAKPTAASLGAVFPLGMAIGRLSASVLIKWRYIFLASIATSLIGTLIIGFGVSMPQLIFGLLLAGIGNALLYPITVDDLVALPGLSPNRAAALSALGGGATIFMLPIVLPVVQNYLSTGHSLLLLFPVTLLLAILPNGRKQTV